MQTGRTLNLSEALAIFSEHIPDIRKAAVENYRALEEQYADAKEMLDDDEWTTESVHQHVQYLKRTEAAKSLMTVIKRIDGRKRFSSVKSITDADIERAREYPIKDLWAELVNTPIKGGMANCCFHTDNTASLSLRKHNRYHCFGCDAKGDVIDLYMKLNSVPFIEAVKKLI